MTVEGSGNVGARVPQGEGEFTKELLEMGISLPHGIEKNRLGSIRLGSARRPEIGRCFEMQLVVQLSKRVGREA